MNKMEILDNSIFDRNINDVENSNLSIGISYEETYENILYDNPNFLYSNINFISNFVPLPFFISPQLNNNHSQFIVNSTITQKTKIIWKEKEK